MNQAEVLAGLQSIFDEIFLDPVVVTPSLSAKDVDEWDSLMQISLIVAVEAKFGIKFRMGEVEATQNLDDFSKLILRLKQGH